MRGPQVRFCERRGGATCRAYSTLAPESSAAGGGRWSARRKSSVILELPRGDTIRFYVRPIARNEQRLPYVGELRHEDFRQLFTEIVPSHIAEIDRLYEQHGTLIIGCDPELHYSGLTARRQA